MKTFIIPFIPRPYCFHFVIRQQMSFHNNHYCCYYYFYNYYHYYYHHHHYCHYHYYKKGSLYWYACQSYHTILFVLVWVGPGLFHGWDLVTMVPRPQWQLITKTRGQKWQRNWWKCWTKQLSAPSIIRLDWSQLSWEWPAHNSSSLGSNYVKVYHRIWSIWFK